MRKNEYVHLHALFVELRRHLQETGEVPDDAFAAYEAYGVGPMAIHRRKDDHHEALQLLLEGVSTTLIAQHEKTTDTTATLTVPNAESMPAH